MRSLKLLEAVRSLNCVCCGREGVQAAHSNLLEHGKGRGIKATDAAIMALCPACHADLDSGSTLTKERKKQLQYEFISKTYIALMQNGKVSFVK
jgi:hypothetical protein